jgi:preprotein translocase subunit YajC
VTSFLIGIGQASSAPPAGGNPIMSFLPLILIFGVFYFLIMRPQAKKQKEHQRLLGEIKKGDDVVTTGGIIGRVTGVKDTELVLQVQEGVRLRVLRSAVQGKYTASTAVTPAADDKAAQKS